jgi:tRNA A-37 threonylcarbamoyl transferase component Bud32
MLKNTASAAWETRASAVDAVVDASPRLQAPGPPLLRSKAQAPRHSSPAPPPDAPVIRVDGKAVMDMLKEELMRMSKDGDNKGGPVRRRRDSRRMDPMVHSILTFIMKEFLYRNSKQTQSGGNFKDVVNQLAGLSQGMAPVTSRSKKSCLAAFDNAILIGNGSYGSVYSFDSVSHAKYALKVVHFTPLSKPKKYLNIINEIKIGRLMGDMGVGPKIHNVYRCNENGGVKVMTVMQLMSMGDIETFCRTRILTDRHIDRILLKLDKMHLAGFVHNDLHSGNIMVDRHRGGFDFYIADFGFANKATPEGVERDRRHVLQYVSFVNKGRIWHTLEDMYHQKKISVSVDFQTRHDADAADCGEYSGATALDIA